MKINIYRIIDPETKNPVYIGATQKKIEIRLKQHLTSPQSAKMYKWVNELKSAPTVELIEHVNYKDAWVREQYWIDEYSREFELLNDLTPGRYNPNGRYITPAEGKQAISVILSKSQYRSLKRIVEQSETSISKYVNGLIAQDIAAAQTQTAGEEQGK